MAIFGAVIHQQEDFSRSDPFTEGIDKPLGLTINPVQVFKDKNEGLVETLAQEHLLERLKRPPAPDLRVHLGQVRLLVIDAEQCKQIRQCVFEAAVQFQHLANDFLPA